MFSRPPAQAQKEEETEAGASTHGKLIKVKLLLTQCWERGDGQITRNEERELRHTARLGDVQLETQHSGGLDRNGLP